MLKKGFTLIEIIIVVALVSVLAIMALNSSMGSQKQFAFLTSYKETITRLKEPRTLAFTNHMTNGELPQAYGVEINISADPQTVTVFADLEAGQTAFIFDNGTDKKLGQVYTFPDKYEITAFASSTYSTPINKLTISYFPTTGEFFAKDGNTSITDPYIIVKLTDPKNKLEKYIAIYTKSGIVEGYTSRDEAEGAGVEFTNP